MIESGIMPSTETINAVIDGLLKFLYMDDAQHVLKTAAKMGIESDLITFNTLLRALLRKRKFTEAISLLQKMQNTGVQADVVTATIVLNGVYKDSPKKPGIEQIRVILDQMQATGVEANEVTYSAIIEGLLISGNEGAAQDIWRIMEQKGIKPNTISYSIVLKYAFQKGDLAGVDRLRTQLQASGVVPDNRMWVTLAAGYARAGDIDAMKGVLAAMEAVERTLPLAGYSAILRELDARGLLEVARELVEEVISLELISRDSTAMGVTEKIFWETLERVGGGVVLAQLKASGAIVK
jgi:pentatricopeptide repeat protein